MENLLTALRSILGTPDFYSQSSGYSGNWNYDLMLEYLVGAIILCVVITSVFRFLGKLVSR